MNGFRLSRNGDDIIIIRYPRKWVRNPHPGVQSEVKIGVRYFACANFKKDTELVLSNESDHLSVVGSRR